jgi:hypothetical protein
MTVDPRRAYIITFRRSLRYWRTTNLSEVLCPQQAIRSAKEKHPLDESQQRDVDEFLKDELRPRANISPSVGASESVRVDYDAE